MSNMTRRWASMALVAATALGWAGACSDDGDPVEPGTTTGVGAIGGGGTGGSTGGGGGAQGLPNGEPCTDPLECQSANCVDGVCCNGGCARDCEACDVAGSEGMCLPHDAASNPDDLCTGGVCDGTGECAIGAHLWSAGYGSAAQEQRVQAIAVDNQGNIIVVGYYSGTINFGGPGDELSSVQDYDIFVAKLGADGSHLWSKSFGGTGFQLASDVDVDVINGMVITGSFEDTVNFGSAADELTSAGDFDVFVARLDADGNHVYSHGFGDAAYQHGHALVVTPCGDLVITGTFAGTVNFGSAGDELGATGPEDLFVARFLPDGTHRWSHGYGHPTEIETGHALAADIDGNVFLVGEFAGNIDFGAGPLIAQGLRDLFVLKLDPDGALLWNRGVGDADDQVARAVAVDPESNVVLAGGFRGTINFGAAGDELACLGGTDPFLAKLDPDGNHLWSQSFGGTEAHFAEDVVVDWRGSIVVGGSLGGAMDVGGQSVSSAGLDDAFLAKLAADGTALWAQSFGDEMDQHGTSVAVDSERRILLAGGYGGSPDLGGGPLPGQTAVGAFIAQLGP